MVNANVNSWRNNCKMDLKHIKETVEDAKRKIIDVMPENLPKRKRMLAPFLNLNPKKISLHAKHNTDDQQDFIIESNMEKKTTLIAMITVYKLHGTILLKMIRKTLELSARNWKDCER